MTLTIPNTAPDEGLSAGFNSWFTFFGQFFDHGLDLVTKGGNGMVIVPLQPDDPLYVEGGDTNFMVLTRATQFDGPGADGVLGDDPTTLGVDESLMTRPTRRRTPRLRSSTRTKRIPLIPRTRCSCASTCSTRTAGRSRPASCSTTPTTVAFRPGPRSRPRPLTMLGIELSDFDVHDVPLLRTDLYGNFIPDRNGLRPGDHRRGPGRHPEYQR